ncbi:cytochrome C oxidase subunit IV family protein [Chitinophagaceae bacterium LB-8]|uniref:Cytochrome C oxidase subunit IV family protein n=1 Tax=Paraflavisolibacter caeni TaxID=2982496 RepID=A0A9X2XYM6_9BACT|nr:cytochrome C oxidase subunit IV family protein [Paraflavisolibacter caeni]MCU7551247.1 cytochrome C oxidase subunit IV family protein [Paraflavisolibacter caeni]
MDQLSQSTEITYHHEPAEDTSRIWKTFWILLGITVIELGLGLFMYLLPIPAWVDVFIKGVIVILTMAKAFYIVSIFMHLGDEIRNMIMTIALPLLLFIWFIAAFLWDGNEFRTSRNRYDKHFQEQTMKRQIRMGDTSQHSFE